MTNPVTSTANNGVRTAYQSFHEQVDLSKLYEGLDKRGIRLSAEEKKEFERILEYSLKKYDGGSIVGNDFGVLITRLAYMLFSFLGGITSTSFSEGVGSVVGQFGNRVTHTGEMDKLRTLSNAMVEVHSRMRAAGGNLSAAAELVSGMAVGKAPERMEESAYLQIRDSINLPWGTPTELSEAKPGAIPQAPPSSPLTPRR